MPQLEADLWIEDGYYVDFDPLGQFRVFGPNNHLYCGLVNIPRERLRIDRVRATPAHALIVDAAFLDDRVALYFPVMDDVRQIYELVRADATRRAFVSFLEIRHRSIDQAIPRDVHIETRGRETTIIFRRHYGQSKYSVGFTFGPEATIEEVDAPYRGYRIRGNAETIPFRLTARTNDPSSHHPLPALFRPHDLDFSIFRRIEEGSGSARTVHDFWDRTAVEIRHMVEWGKTSGDVYGTIFPRDWMEAADLGVHDLTDDARAYMYTTPLRHISPEGEGWHEDVVGEYRFQYQVGGRDIFDRRMIDIEPHILMGLRELPPACFTDPQYRDPLRRVAEYVLRQARTNDLITFKRRLEGANGTHAWRESDPSGAYHAVGNWRDNPWSFKKVAERIAPFDVNAVFYPVALRMLREFGAQLDCAVPDIAALIERWDGVRERYRFTGPDGRSGFDLALYDVSADGSGEWRGMRQHHLDESYLYTYAEAAPEDLRSFCERLLDPDYFFTESGPLLNARVHNPHGYTTAEYHGLVIWAKQVAYVMLGVMKHLRIGIERGWPRDLLELLRRAAGTTAETTIRAFLHLDAIPELHYDANGTPSFFFDQPNFIGTMSKVQLWSAVGARRIFRKYAELQTQERYRVPRSP